MARFLVRSTCSLNALRGAQIARLGGALALAPFVDLAAVSAQKRMQLDSKRSALMLMVTGCLMTAMIAFGATVLAWA